MKLKTKLSKLRHDGHITDAEYAIIINMLNKFATQPPKTQQKVEQPCEDAISREEAIRVAEQGQIQGYEWQFKKLCNLPSVTPQRKTGKWIILDECANEGVYCSECHKKVFKLEFSPTMKWQNFEYCPNCGARMIESEGEE
jgi:hypothetical protein